MATCSFTHLAVFAWTVFCWCPSTPYNKRCAKCTLNIHSDACTLDLTCDEAPYVPPWRSSLTRHSAGSYTTGVMVRLSYDIMHATSWCSRPKDSHTKLRTASKILTSPLTAALRNKFAHTPLLGSVLAQICTKNHSATLLHPYSTRSFGRRKRWSQLIFSSDTGIGEALTDSIAPLITLRAQCISPITSQTCLEHAWIPS